MTEAQNPLTPRPVRFAQPGPSLNLETPRRALAIGAHPDDVDFGCGSTLAKWAAAGCEVHLLVCTDGSKGTWDQAQDLAELVATRQSEQQMAAKALGATGQVGFLGYVDGLLESNREAQGRVCEWIRKTKPDVVLAHDPWKRYRLHPDHRHAGFLATDGVVAARDATFFPEQAFEHHRPEALLLFEAQEPDHVEEVTGFSEAKVQALLAHRSQLRSTMHVDNSAEVELRAKVERLLADVGQAAGLDTGYGEAFKLIDDL